MHSRRLALFGYLSGSLAAACEAPPPAEPVVGTARLVNPFDWTALSPADDPFADHRPPDAACPADSFGGEPFAEQYALEVRTGAGRCTWLSAAQPTLAPIAAGDAIRVRVWHFELQADARTEAHTALTIGGQLLWQRRVAIPADGGLLLDTVTAPRSWPAGTPLVFHLHNHGANTWNLLEVTARPDAADAGL